MSEALSARLKEQGIELPKVVPPVAAYTPARKIGEGKIRTSGQLPMRDGSLVATGHVGEGEVALEDAQEAARACALNALAAAVAIAGSEDAITGVEAVTAFVSSKPDFTDQAQVANGAARTLGCWRSRPSPWRSRRGRGRLHHQVTLAVENEPPAIWPGDFSAHKREKLRCPS